MLEINLEKIVGLKIEFAAVDVVVGQVHQCLQLDWSYGLGSHETNDQIHAIGDIAEGQVVCLFGFLSFLHLWTFLCACPCACLCLCLLVGSASFSTSTATSLKTIAAKSSTILYLSTCSLICPCNPCLCRCTHGQPPWVQGPLLLLLVFSIAGLRDFNTASVVQLFEAFSKLSTASRSWP